MSAESPKTSRSVSTFSSRLFVMLLLTRRLWQARGRLLVLPLHRNRTEPMVSQNQADVLRAPKAGHCHQTSVGSSMMSWRYLLQQCGRSSKRLLQEKSANCGERVGAYHCRRKFPFSTHELLFEMPTGTLGCWRLS